MLSLCGHEKLVKPMARLDVRKYSLSNRVVDEWNSLPKEIIHCRTVSNFKKKLDHHLRVNRGFI